MARKKVEEEVEDDDLDELEVEEDDEDDADEDPDDADDDVDSDEETEVVEDEDDEEEEEVEGYAMGDDLTEDESAAGDRMSGLAADVPVQVVAVLGKRSFNLKDLMAFHVGQVVDLYRPANETVDLVVGGKLIAKGELVSIDGKLGVKIVKLI